MTAISPPLESAVKKAAVAALVAAITVFLKEYAEQQERLDKEERAEHDEVRSGGRRLPFPLPWG